MPLQPWQIEELARIIRAHVDYWTYVVLGPEAITQEALDEAVATGLLPPTTTLDMIKYSFVLGRLDALLTEEQFEELSWDQLKKEAEKFQPTTIFESRAMEEAQASAAIRIQKLGDDVRNGLFIELQNQVRGRLSPQYVQGIIQDTVASAIDERKAAATVASELYRKLGKGNYAMDFLQVASTEMHDAYTKGKVSVILNKEGRYKYGQGDDSNVFFTPAPGACRECTEAYVDPSTGNPRVFKLSDVLANGDNVGVPKRLRNVGSTGKIRVRAVLPPHHPWCRCQVETMLLGHGFDEEGKIQVEDADSIIDDIFAKVDREMEEEARLGKGLYIRKARAYPIGYISTRADGRKWQKVAQGEWVPVQEEVYQQKQEEEKEQIREKIPDSLSQFLQSEEYQQIRKEWAESASEFDQLGGSYELQPFDEESVRDIWDEDGLIKPEYLTRVLKSMYNRDGMSIYDLDTGNVDWDHAEYFAYILALSLVANRYTLGQAANEDTAQGEGFRGTMNWLASSGPYVSATDFGYDAYKWLRRNGAPKDIFSPIGKAFDKLRGTKNPRAAVVQEAMFAAKEATKYFGDLDRDKMTKMLVLSSQQKYDPTKQQMIARAKSIVENRGLSEWYEMFEVEDAAVTSNFITDLCEAVQDQFGIPGIYTPRRAEEERVIYGNEKNSLREYVKLVYGLSHASFEEAGIKDITLYRGLKAGSSLSERMRQGRKDVGFVGPFIGRPLSAWTGDKEVAEYFSKDDGWGRKGTILRKDYVPVELLFNNPQMFIVNGCDEYLMINHEDSDAVVEKAMEGEPINLDDEENADWISQVIKERDSKRESMDKALPYPEETAEYAEPIHDDEQQTTMGNCFRYALHTGIHLGEGAKLVHGTLKHPLGHDFQHAWVEHDDHVYDAHGANMNPDSPWSVEKFHQTYQPKDTKEYHPPRAFGHVVKTGHYGPWEEHEVA